MTETDDELRDYDECVEYIATLEKQLAKARANPDPRVQRLLDVSRALSNYYSLKDSTSQESKEFIDALREFEESNK